MPDVLRQDRMGDEVRVECSVGDCGATWEGTPARSNWCEKHSGKPKAEPWAPTRAEIEAARDGAAERSKEAMEWATSAWAEQTRKVSEAAPSDATHWKSISGPEMEFDAVKMRMKITNRVTYATLPEGHGLIEWVPLAGKEGVSGHE